MQLHLFSTFLCISSCLLWTLAAQTTDSTTLSASVAVRNKACSNDYDCTAYGAGSCSYGYCHYYTQDIGQRCGGNQYSGQTWDYCKYGLACSNVDMYFLGTCAKPCSTSSNCGSSQYCLKSLGQSEGICTDGCDASYALCADGRVCTEGTCYTCGTQAYACPTGFTCSNGACIASDSSTPSGECYRNADCAGSNKVCSRNTCMDACDPRVCPTRNHYCDYNQCKVGCLSDANCDSSYEKCDTTTRTCVSSTYIPPPSADVCIRDDQCTAMGQGNCLGGSCHYYTQDLGEPCGDNGLGNWNYCMKDVGLICTDFKTTGGEGTCYRTCTSHSGCATNEFCYGLDKYTQGFCKVGCRDDSACNGQLCNSQTGKCEACRDSLSCGPSQYCNLYGKCEAGCDYFKACPQPQVCAGNTCVSQCNPLFCKPGTGKICKNDLCVTGCNTQSDCPSNKKCDSTTLKCEDLCFGVNCGAGNYCNSSTGQCASGCLSDNNCAQGEFCNGNRVCEDRCDDGTACPANTYCEGKSCVPGCRNMYDCASNQYCVNGQCTTPCDINNDPCPVNSFCNRMFCQPGCRTDANCPSGKSCNAEGRCVASCSRDTCPLNNICVGLNCVAGCALDSDCTINKKCVTGKCVDKCTEDTCYGGRYCNDSGVCVAGCRIGYDDCASTDYCDPRTYICKEKCSLYNCRPLGYGQYCKDNLCTSGCQNNSHCTTNDYCDTSSGKCKAKCTYAICYGDKYCKDDYTCVLKAGGSSVTAGSVIALGKTRCTADRDCVSGKEYCDLAYSVCMTRCTDTSCGRNYRCVNYRSCVPNVVDLGCSYDRDCGTGSYCNSKTRQCVANCSTKNCAGSCKDIRTCVAKKAECSWDEECTKGQYCSKGVCKAVSGRLCYTNVNNYCGLSYTCVGLSQYKRYNIGQCYPQTRALGKCGYTTYPVQCPSGYLCKKTSASTLYGICTAGSLTSKSVKTRIKASDLYVASKKTTTKTVAVKQPPPPPPPPSSNSNQNWSTGDDFL